MLINGNSLEVLPTLSENSVDAVVCDPPYELGFMGKTWDRSGIANNVQLWREVLRVLKPGGHLVAFGGTRTYHRMTCAIEDAGFEVRDCLAWLYGVGFPKSLNLGDGRGTALKPAHEPAVLARKPLTGTVAATVQEWGTGALNVDACRIATDDGYTENAVTQGINTAQTSYAPAVARRTFEPSSLGRWPANVLLDEEAAAMLDEQTEGVLHSAGSKAEASPNGGRPFKATSFKHGGKGARIGDSGGASRFFYCAKASKRERGGGNSHPTVKPLALMRYLIRLVTPPGGTVLDPFAGSGSTGVAAMLEERPFIGIELQPEYAEIARRRIEAAAPAQPALALEVPA